MIRLIIAFIGVFLIWVVFFSESSKNQKTAIVVISLLLCILGFWFESNLGKPRADVVQASQIETCGVVASHSYRSNFDLDLCLKNNADEGDVTRLSFTIAAQRCNDQGVCDQIQSIDRALLVDLPAKETLQLKQNLSFSELDPSLEDVQWSVTIHSVKAIR